MAIELAMTCFLRCSEVPISFFREDQWTHFSKPGKFLLVLDPVVATVKVMIDGGSGLNVLFMSTLKEIGLDIT